MDYQEYGLTLTKGQADKLKRAAAKGCPVSIRLSHTNLSGDHRMLLTRRQLQKIHKLLQSGKGGMTLELSSKQVKQNVMKLGGFLPILAGLAASALPVLAKTLLPALGVGALSGLGSAAISKAVGSGLYLKRGGKVCCHRSRQWSASQARLLAPNLWGWIISEARPAILRWLRPHPGPK